MDSSAAQKIPRRSRLNQLLVSEATGFLGSIWIHWENARVEIVPLVIYDQIINASVRQNQRTLWVLSAVYASPRQLYGITYGHLLKL